MPELSVQDYALYAYDYEAATTSGTPLGQDVHTVRVSSTSAPTFFQFKLEDPGGPDDEVPGLMTGVEPFPRSVDFRRAEWDAGYSGTAPSYSIVWGDGMHGEPSIGPLAASSTNTVELAISVENEDVVTKGSSNDADVDVGLELKAEAELSAGYEGSFGQSIETTTRMGTNVEAELQVPNCKDLDCINAITVQPYLLQATGSSAPWIPTGRAQLPWLLTWQVTYWKDNSGNQGGSSLGAERASGSVVGGTGGAVTTNGYRWASWTHDGTWTRDHEVWTFRRGKGTASEAAVLRLDLGQLTWDFTLSRTDLSPWIKAGEAAVHVGLKVNSRYSFATDLEPQVESAWNAKVEEVPGHPLSRWLETYRGSYDPSTGTGEAVIAGRIPEGRSTFGDLSFSVNGHQGDARLIVHPDYASAPANGRVLVYEREGLRLTVDFGGKTWTARVDGQAFHARMVPRGGSVKLAAKLGGVLQHQVEVPVKDYTSKLTYRRW